MVSNSCKAHPGHIPMVASTIAKIKGVTLDEVLKVTRENLKKVYGI